MEKIVTRRHQTVMPLALFVVVMGMFALNWPFAFTNGFLSTMGGESTIGALRVLNGEIPYRDFWTLYAPGHFYLLALLFHVFGLHLMVEVVAASVFMAVAICLNYWLIRRITKSVLLGVGAAAILFALVFNSEYYYIRFETYPPTLLFIFVTLLLSLFYYETQKPRYLILAGVATGIIALNKHDVGVYMAIATSIGLIIYHITNRSSSISRWRLLLSTIFMYGCSAAAIVLPILLYFAIVSGPDAWQDVVVFPLTKWRYSRPESYPSLFAVNLGTGSLTDRIEGLFEYIKFALPLFINLFGIMVVVLAVRVRNAILAAVSATLWIGFWFHYYAAHLQINTHIITMSAYAASLGLILFYLASYKTNSEEPSRQLAMGRVLAALIVCGWCVVLVSRPLYKLSQKYTTPTIALSLPRVSGFQVTPEEVNSLNELVAGVAQRLAADQYIYIGLARHDAMVTNDMLLYFVLDYPIAVRYHDLHPAVADTSTAQHEMIADIEKQQVPLLLTRSYFSDPELDAVKDELRQHVPDVGATDLDEYIQQNYAAVEKIGPYTIWLHNAAARAADMQPIRDDQ